MWRLWCGALQPWQMWRLWCGALQPWQMQAAELVCSCSLPPVWRALPAGLQHLQVVAQEDGAVAGMEPGSACSMWLHRHALAGLTSMQVRG